MLFVEIKTPYVQSVTSPTVSYDVHFEDRKVGKNTSKPKKVLASA